MHFFHFLRYLALLCLCTALAQDSTFDFAGREWIRKSHQSEQVGPGFNYFSGNEENIWLDDEGLHLAVTRRENGGWYSAEVFSAAPTGYGLHCFYIDAWLDSLDMNAVFGLFLYADDAHEIDIEFAKWGEHRSENNAQYTVQPWIVPDNSVAFPVLLDGTYTTHCIDWQANYIEFHSFHGHHANAGKTIYRHRYENREYIPAVEDGLRIHMNLWLFDLAVAPENPPSPGKDGILEVVIKNVTYPISK